MRIQRARTLSRQTHITPKARYSVQTHAIGWLIIAPCFWAGNFIVGRLLRGDVAPITLNFWRWVLALILLLSFSHGQLYRHRALLRQQWKLVVACGATGIAAFQVMTYQALTLTTAINATLITASAPLAIVMCGKIVFRTTVTRAQWLALLSAALGAVVIITQGRVEALLALQLNRGDLWMLAAVVVWSTYALLLTRCPRELPAIALLTASVAAAIAVMLPFYLWRLGMGERLVLNLPNLLGIGYSATFSSVIAFFAWTRGVAVLGSTRAGMFINLIPVFAALQSPLLLGEPLAAYHLAGAALVFGGIVLANWRFAAQAVEPTQPEPASDQG